MNLRRLLWLVPALGFLVVARAAEPDPELVNAEKTLAEAKVETDGAALLRFFRERTLTEADVSRLGGAVQRLGDDDFETREKAADELIRAGRKALPFLKAAQDDKDPERARRVALCLQEIDSRADLTRIAAAARVLQERRPEGATAVLLAYLPALEDEDVEETLLRTLLAVGINGGKPDTALVQALTDKEPLRRAAAGYVLGRADPGQRAAVRRLLADAEPRVRYEAAVALARAGDKQSVPALIALVGEGPLPIGWRAQEVLYRIAGEKAPAVALADDKPAERAKVAGAWRDWWKEREPITNLASINLDETMLGINLICDDGGRVWACRGDGKPIWEIKGVSAWDAQLLPNGHVLIGEYGGGQVTERDTTGKVLWTYMSGNTISSVQRLPNGNTFISTFGEMMEVDPKGTRLFTYKHPSGGLIARAHHLRNGHFVFACGDKFVELDAKMKELRTVPVQANGDSWISVEPLRGERYLVAPYGASRVYETDAAGKIYFDVKSEHPMSAVRLPSGNTLVSSNTGHSVFEYDRTGKVVWTLNCGAGVRCVRRY